MFAYLNPPLLEESVKNKKAGLIEVEVDGKRQHRAGGCSTSEVFNKEQTPYTGALSELNNPPPMCIAASRNYVHERFSLHQTKQRQNK